MNKYHVAYESPYSMKKLEDAARNFFKKKINKLIKNDDDLLEFFNSEKIEKILEDIGYNNIPLDTIRDIRAITIQDVKTKEVNPKHYIQYLFKYIDKLGFDYIELKETTLLEKIMDKKRPSFCEVFVIEMTKEMISGDKQIKSYIEDFIESIYKGAYDEYNLKKEMVFLHEALKIQEKKIERIKTCASLKEVTDLATFITNDYNEQYNENLLQFMVHSYAANTEYIATISGQDCKKANVDKIGKLKNLYAKLLESLVVHPKVGKIHFDQLSNKLEASLFVVLKDKTRFNIECIEDKNNLLSELNEMHNIFNTYRSIQEQFKIGDTATIFEQSESKLALKININKLIINCGGVENLILETIEGAGEEILNKVNQKQNVGLVMKSLNIKKDTDSLIISFKLHENFEKADRAEMLDGVTKILINAIENFHQKEFWLIKNYKYNGFKRIQGILQGEEVINEAKLNVSNLNREYALWKKIHEQEALAPKQVTRSTKRKI